MKLYVLIMLMLMIIIDYVNFNPLSNPFIVWDLIVLWRAEMSCKYCLG